MRTFVLSAGAILIALAAAANAQTTGGATLVGNVTDSTGAVLPGAKVTVVNVETAFRSETQTGPEGNYYVPYLSPGNYRITVEAAGFRRYVREGIVLRTGETPRVDIMMELGSTTEAVTVSAAVALLATENATSGQILEGQNLVSIPTPQKRIVRMLAYFPGTVASSGYHILGQRQRAIGYSLDGMSGKTPGTNELGDLDQSVQTTQEAIQEVKVVTSGMSAEIGHSAGGSMNIVYGSGTNELHGSAEERYINKNLVQRDYFQQTKDPSPLYYHFIDSSLSGPFNLPKLYSGKNRTFFLIGYGDFLQNGGSPLTYRTVPSEAMYNGDFSFGGQGLPIYNPFTTRQDASGRWIRDPFPGNIIPSNLSDPVAKNFLARNPFTKPNDPGVITRTGPQQNRLDFEPKYIRRTRWDVKVDHQFSSDHKIFGRYSQGHHRADRGNFHAEIAWKDIDTNAQPIPTDQVNGVFSDTLVLGPKRFNEFRVGYNRRASTLGSLTYNQDWGKQLGMPNVSPLTFPFFNIGYALGSLGRSYQIGEDMSMQDNFTQILGSHTVKMGYELYRTRFNAATEALPSGTYNFGGTELPFTPNTGNAFASFLLGTVSSAVFTQDFATWLPRWWQHSFYVQDDWKAARGLTLSFGVRWSYESPFQTKYGQQSQFDPKVVDRLTGRMGAVTHPKGPLASKDLNNFQPRLGLAWSFRPKWVFRSSFGLMTQDLGVNDLIQNFQEYTGTVNVQGPPGDPQHVFRLSQGPPSFRTPLQPDGSAPFVGSNYSARAANWYDPNMRMPYILSWSAGVQYQFARNWLLELMYQGTAGVGLLNNWNINAISLDVSRDPAVLGQIFRATQNYLPYPQFGQISHYSNYGHSTYHGGNIRVERRYSAGLTMISFYTYSKTLDESDSDGAAGGITYYNRRLEKGRAGYDIRHHFVNLLVYELPFGKGRRWLNHGRLLNGAAGGWNVTWTQSFESGLPTTVTFAGSPNQYLPGAARPNALVPMEQALVQDWGIGPNRFPTSAQNPYLVFNAFAYPAAFTPGAVGRNTFESPGLNWTQISLAKNFSVGERLRFTLRGDFNNLPFKQPQFAQPNSVYNANSPLTFGRFTGTRGGLASIPTARPHIVLGLRMEF